MADIFISYKRQERDCAKAIAEALIEKGYNVWWDIELLPGYRFADEIAAVIRVAKVVIVLWSKSSITSDFVRSEADLARKQNKLLPARLDDVEIPVPFSVYETLDLTN